MYRLDLKKIIKSLTQFCCTNRLIFSFFVYPIILLANLMDSDFVDKLVEDKYVLEEGQIAEREISFNNIQAMVGLIQLKRINELNNKRIYYGGLLSKLLSDVKEIHIPTVGFGRTHIFLYFCIFSKEAKLLRKYLAWKGIDTKKGSMRACSLLSFFKNDRNTEMYPIAENLANNVIELPCSSSLDEKDIYYQAKIIKEFFYNRRRSFI